MIFFSLKSSPQMKFSERKSKCDLLSYIYSKTICSICPFLEVLTKSASVCRTTDQYSWIMSYKTCRQATVRSGRNTPNTETVQNKILEKSHWNILPDFYITQRLWSSSYIIHITFWRLNIFPPGGYRASQQLWCFWCPPY